MEVQLLESVSIPAQAKPPLLGAGESQALVLPWVQALSRHSDHADHWPQTPSTENHHTQAVSLLYKKEYTVITGEN